MLRRGAAAVILVPLAVIIIAFAVENREAVTVSFDPFSASEPAASVTLPLFALIVLALIIGVLIGGFAAWLGQGKWRSTARRLRRDLHRLREHLAALEGGAAKPGIEPERSNPSARPLKLKLPAR